MFRKWTPLQTQGVVLWELSLGLACISMLVVFASMSGLPSKIPMAHGTGSNTTSGESPTSTESPTPLCTRSWTLVSSPNVADTGNVLNGVSAVSEEDVWAIGNFGYGEQTRPSAIHWDGTSWNMVNIAGAAEGASTLYAIDSLSSSDVWAVGWSEPFPTRANILIEHWDGTQWSIVATPDMGNQSYLYDIEAIAPDDVWAVGLNYAQPSASLIMHWNGIEWRSVPSPNPPNSGLFGVTAVSHNDVWAVGTWAETGNPGQPLMMHWDGIAWTMIPALTSTYDYMLTDVKAASSNDVWAVGVVEPYSFARLLTMHWDGVSWSELPVPSVYASRHTRVALTTRNEPWLTGVLGLGTGRPLALHWDGRRDSWQWVSEEISVAPDRSAPGGIATDNSNNIWVVGGYSGTKTLTLRNTETCSTITESFPSPTYASTPAVTPTSTPVLVSGRASLP
jgi:hypothetical protein